MLFSGKGFSSIINKPEIMEDRFCRLRSIKQRNHEPITFAHKVERDDFHELVCGQSVG